MAALASRPWQVPSCVVARHQLQGSTAGEARVRLYVRPDPAADIRCDGPSPVARGCSRGCLATAAQSGQHHQVGRPGTSGEGALLGQHGYCSTVWQAVEGVGWHGGHAQAERGCCRGGPAMAVLFCWTWQATSGAMASCWW